MTRGGGRSKRAMRARRGNWAANYFSIAAVTSNPGTTATTSLTYDSNGNVTQVGTKQAERTVAGRSTSIPVFGVLALLLATAALPSNAGTIEPGGGLGEAERATVELFERVSPSVVAVSVIVAQTIRRSSTSAPVPDSFGMRPATSSPTRERRRHHHHLACIG
jgi:hypothetical protein